MGLFKESTWGAEKSGKSLVKRLSKKRREKEHKRKLKILNASTNDPKTDKNKNKKETDFKILNKTQKKGSPKNAQVQNSQEELKQKPVLYKLKNYPTSLESIKTVTNSSKTKLKLKKKLEIIQNKESLKKKLIQDQGKNSQSSKGKKRKRSELEVEVGQVKKPKKPKKTKPQKGQIEKPEVKNNIFEETSVSKKKNKKKKENGNIHIDENLQFPRLVGIDKIRKMIQDRKQEIKQQKVSPLRERMLAHLRSSRFRFINESLYSTESSESNKYFKEDPEAFAAYHEGYKQQVARWPLNPVDVIIASIKKMPKDYIVADFGCGEAKLADSVSQIVHSFDLVALNDKVKACDMSHTPLLTNGVNVVVFCLSLMGTNLSDFLLEANRVLKNGGIMKIAEVESRFDNVENFIKLVSSYGFVNTWADLSNQLFYFLDFKKEKNVDKGNKKLPKIELNSCLYKKR